MCICVCVVETGWVEGGKETHLYVRVCVFACVCVHVYLYMCMYLYKSIYKSICIFAESQHAFTGVVEHHACAGVYVRLMF